MRYVFKRWTIKVNFASMDNHMVFLQMRDECYMTANTKLSDFPNSVCLSSKELADQFVAAVLPTMVKRHGERVELEVVDRGPQGSDTSDDELVRARIEQKLFAPNKRPKLGAR